MARGLTAQEMAEMLASDDDLPDFSESPETPAYLDDNRFKNRPPYFPEPKSSSECCILKGMLREDDLRCVKSMEKEVPDDLLVWFAKYLMDKDRHSHWGHTSCLVSESDSYVFEEKKEKKEKKEEKEEKDIPTTCDKEKFTYRIEIKNPKKFF